MIAASIERRSEAIRHRDPFAPCVIDGFDGEAIRASRGVGMAKDKAITSQTRERNGLRGRCRLLRRDGRKIKSLLGRINHQRAAASIVGKIKRRVSVVSEKRKMRR